MHNRSSLTITIKRNSRKAYDETFTEFPIVFGRGNECHLKLSEFDFISRTHGAITIQNGSIHVTDLNSSNGIIFDGKKNFDFFLKKKGSFFVKDLEFYLELKEPHTEATVALSDEDGFGSDISQLKTVVFKTQVVKSPIPYSIHPVKSIANVSPRKLCLQAIITWGGDIFDVRNFYVQDPILMGGKDNFPIYIPFLKKQSVAGLFNKNGAVLNLKKNVNWSLFRDGKEVDFVSLENSQRIVPTQSQRSFGKVILSTNEVFSMTLNHDVMIHYRYVKIPRPLVKKTWIENREEYKKAIWTSLVVHFLIVVIITSATPKRKIREIPNVPPRIAKLLVEPPAQILAPPPPPIQPIPTPVPKVEPPPPKPPPKMVVPPKIAQQVKSERSKQFLQKPLPSAEEPQKVQVNELANLFNQTAPSKLNAPKIDPSKFKLGGLPNPSLPSISKLALQSKPNSGLIGNSIPSDLGKIGFAGNAKGSKTGKRGVIGGIVGAPKMVSKLNTEQGLTNEAVMKIVNGYLGEVQRCYERALFADSELAGRVEYEWDISPIGSVTGVRIKRSDMAKADKLNECVVSLFKRMKFPKAANKLPTTANIGFPFGKN